MTAGATAGATAVPEAVTFDYWNTLCYEPNLDQRRGLLAESWGSLFADAGVGVTADELVAAYDAARAEYWKAWHENRQFTGTDAAHHCLQALAARTSLDHLTDVLVDAFHGCSDRAEIAPVEGVATVLESLHNASVRVGIVCDVGLMASPYLRGHLERLGLLGYFRHWSFSARPSHLRARARRPRRGGPGANGPHRRPPAHRHPGGAGHWNAGDPDHDRVRR